MTDYAPCKDCQEHAAGCHGTCPKYAAFRYNNRLIRAARRRETLESVYGGKGGVSAAEEIQKKMKRFFLVGNIDDVLNELRALAALETFRDGRLADVL